MQMKVWVLKYSNQTKQKEQVVIVKHKQTEGQGDQHTDIHQARHDGELIKQVETREKGSKASVTSQN